MLYVYVDDSFDQNAQRVCALAGVVGTFPAWRLLEREWTVRTGGVPFHAKDCDSDQGDYAKTPHAENKELYRDLTTMLANSHIYGCAVVVDLMAKAEAFPDTMDISYYWAFVRLVHGMKELARLNGEAAEFDGGVAEFTLDKRPVSDYNARFLYESIRENEPDWMPFLSEKIHSDSARSNPRLQVADLFAREAMKSIDNRIGPTKRPMRLSWQALSDSDRFVIKAYSRDWFNDLKAAMPNLETKVRFNRQDYVEWLPKRAREHNVTNLLQLINDIAKRDAGSA